MPRLRRPPPDLDDDDDCREKPGQRNAANARERARMRILSKAFSRLKTTLPWVPPDTKLSKLDTLRLATSYIAHLRTILKDGDDSSPIVHPLNLTWPFTIQTVAVPECKSPPWSSEDSPNTQNPLTIGDSSSCADEADEESEKNFDSRCYGAKNFPYLTDHRHYSDSLLNIG